MCIFPESDFRDELLYCASNLIEACLTIYLTFFPPNECKLEETKQEVRKLEKDLQNLKSKAKGDKQLCKDLQEKVYRIDEGKI